jgi:hypothetical protein
MKAVVGNAGSKPQIRKDEWCLETLCGFVSDDTMNKIHVLFLPGYIINLRMPAAVIRGVYV